MEKCGFPSARKLSVPGVVGPLMQWWSRACVSDGSSGKGNRKPDTVPASGWGTRKAATCINNKGSIGYYRHVRLSGSIVVTSMSKLCTHSVSKLC